MFQDKINTEIDMSPELWLMYEEEHKAFVSKKIKEFLEGFLTEDRIAFRKNYLENQIELIKNEITKLKSDYQESVEEDETYINRAVLVAAIEKREKTKRKLKLELRILEGKKIGGLTNEQICLARSRRFEDFLPLKRGKTNCPFHDDKNPSFSVKNNYGNCFGCGWKGGIVQFIMDRDGVSFPDAIRSLI